MRFYTKMHQTKVIYIAVLVTLGLLFGCKPDSTSDSKKPPNIILIMADDLGYEGVGCYGNQVLKTPNIDMLAAEGLRFTDFHSNGAVCTPTRAALLTGRYQQRSGMEGVIYVRGATRQTGLDTTEITIAELLKENGYSTGIMGKWHLGYNDEYNPVYHGFDEFYGYRSGNVDFHSHYDNAGIYDWWHNLDSIDEVGYVTDLITEHSLDFIDENKDHPFFLYVPHEAPHVPFQGRNDPGYRYPNTEFTYYGPVEDKDRAYNEMVEVMDEGIGRIIDKVDQLGLRDNTMIIFISDNGAEQFGHNGSLNGFKGSLLEAGHRVPAIMSWKGNILPGESGATTMTHDLMPTLLSICGFKMDDLNLDGVDISSHLFTQDPLVERPLFWRNREGSAVRYQDYKLIISEHDTLLYNLKSDLGETSDIHSSNLEMTYNLISQLEKWDNEMNQYDQKTR